MQACVFHFSELDPKDRLTVEHYISSDLALMQQIRDAKYPLEPLGKLATVKGGKRLPPNAQYSQTGIPYVRVVDIGPYTIDLDDAVYISEELHKSIERYQLNYNDIGIVIVGATIGKVAIFKSSVKPCNFNENLARITIQNNKINPDYLLAYLQSRFGQASIHWLTGGAAQAKLSLERIERIEIPVPPRPIQDRIAQIMQDAYAARQAKQVEAQSLLTGMDIYILDKLNIQLESLPDNKHFIVRASQLWGRRFDIGPYANRFSTENISSGAWVTLQEVAHLPRQAKTVSKTPDAEFNYVGMSDVNDVTGEVNIHRVLGSQVKANKTVFKGNDIVFARIEPCVYNRKIALIPPDIDMVMGSTELLVARAKPDVILPEFLLWILRSDLIQHQIAGYMTGTTGRRRLPSSAFATLKLPRVPLGLQEEVADEARHRRNRTKELHVEAEEAVNQAKEQIERLILGKETTL